MKQKTMKLHAVVVVLALAITACATTGDSSPDSIEIVTTTTIFGDIVGQIVGDAAVVSVLVPVGVDPHEFQASSRQIAEVETADLVVAVGLGLEEGLGDVLDSAVADGVNVVEIAPRLNPIPFGSGEADDPHVWLDPIRMIKAVDIVVAELKIIDSSIDWETRGDAYKKELEDLDRETTDLVAAIPPGERLLVTNHDSLGYFADRYGFEVIGVVIPGGSSLVDPSSEELANLVHVVEERNVKAIFAETTQPAVLADTVADEVGHDVEVIELYTGSLGAPGSGAETYLGMIAVDTRLITEALSG